MAVLVVRNGPLAGRRVDVTGELLIGRGSVDLPIDDAQMSRRHAAVRSKEDGLEVEDLGSLNGTRVNGVRIHGAATLTDGDLIEVGDTQILVQSAAVASDATVARPPADATVARPSPAPPQQPVQAPPPRPDPAAATPAPVPPAAAAERPPATLPEAPAASQPPPSAPFGVLSTGPRVRGRRRIATREIGPLVAALVVIGGTAVALVLYFAGVFVN